jgi:hypothetical protein
MAIITRTGIPTYHCINGVACGDIIDPVWVNKIRESQKAVAETGVLASSGSNGLTHGRMRPFNGWAQGSNMLIPEYAYFQMLEMSKDFTHYVLEFSIKLGDRGGGRAMQALGFYLQDPMSGIAAKIGEAKLASFSPGPVSPITFNVTPEVMTRIRIVQPIPIYMLALLQQGEVGSFDLWNKLTIYGSVGAFTINDQGYWSGLLAYELKFFRECP